MNLLIITEGNEPDIPPSSFFDEVTVDKALLLYLSPCIRASQYKKKLYSVIKTDVEIEIINPKSLVDFENSRNALLDFIASVPERLKVAGSNLSEYLTVQGLNMWWTSGLVEATAYKRNLFQNLYHLSTVYRALQTFDITSVWLLVEDVSLRNDLISMLENDEIKYYQRPASYHWPGMISFLKQLAPIQWLFFFSTHLLYSLLFKTICPRWIRPKRSKSAQKDIHLFYSYYPYTLNLKDGIPEDVIYKDLPSFLSKHLGGKVYHLCYLSPISILSPCQLTKAVKKFWTQYFPFIPMDFFVSIWDILRVFLSPIGLWKYFRLRKLPEYRKAFEIEGIDMFHTFDRAMKNSLVSHEARNNLLHYHSFRRIASRYGKNIFQIVYYLEFHDWEVALINGVKNVDQSIPVVGLQQSAPNPILLSFFFSPKMFKSKENSYPLPDVILCSLNVYKELMCYNGIETKRVEVIGHIAGQYLNQPPLSIESNRVKRIEMGLPANEKLCLVTCSIDLTLTEGIIYLLKHVVTKLPEVFFLIKGHPCSPIETLLVKYHMDELKNVRPMQHLVSCLLPLADYFLSTSTTVSEEAMKLGVPQVNLDVGGLPYANPLHLLPGMIRDVETPDQLMDFFLNTEKYRIPKEKEALFMGTLEVDPYRKFLDTVVSRFHQDS